MRILHVVRPEIDLRTAYLRLSGAAAQTQTQFEPLIIDYHYHSICFLTLFMFPSPIPTYDVREFM